MNLARVLHPPILVHWEKLAIIVGLGMGYILTFVPLYRSVGATAAALTNLPIAVAGYAFGVRAGLLAALLCILANVLLFHLVGSHGWEMMTLHWPGIFAMLMVGWVTGWISELRNSAEEKNRVLNRDRHILEKEIAHRKRVEEALQRAEERLKNLIEDIPGNVYQLRIGADGKVEFPYISSKMWKLLGLGFVPVQELPKRMLEAVAAEDRERFKESLHSCTASFQPWEFEFRSHTTEGVRWVNGRSTPHRERDGGTLWTFICTDVTDRKRVEEALKDSEEKYRQVVENAQEAIFIVQKGKVKFSNPAGLKFSGYSVEELTSRLAIEFIHPDDQKMVMESLRRRLKGKRLLNVPYFRMVDKSGEVRWLEMNSVLITWGEGPAILHFLGDVTARKNAEDALNALNAQLEERIQHRTAELEREVAERKKAEEEIQKSATLLQAAFDGVSNPLVMLDKERRVQILNKAAKEYYRIADLLEAIGQPCYRVLLRKPAACETCNVRVALSRSGIFQYERKGLRDPERIEQITIFPVEEKGKVSGGVIFRVNDITEARLLEKQLIQNEKMASLGLLVSGIAHEISNPNNFIHFNIPILRDYLQELLPIIDGHARTCQGFEPYGMSYPEFRKDLFKILDNMEHGSHRINATISSLKEFSRRKDTKERGWVNLREVIDKATSISQGQLRKMVKSFEVNLSPELPAILTDGGALEQVVINLLINAAQAADKEDSWVRLTAGLGNTWRDRWIIQVSDNGCGMDEKTQAKIFDPFFTTKPSHSGTGLGLYVCQGIVDGLGGRIEVKTDPGKGSTFRVILPDMDRRAQGRSFGIGQDPAEVAHAGDANE